MEFNTRQDLYNYLNGFDFDSVKDTKLSSVYFLVEFGGRVEPIYFTHFEDVWFASPCELRQYPVKEDLLGEYVKEMYLIKSWDDAYEFEKNMQRGDYHYEIDCPQCAPFLPDKIKIMDTFSDSKCLDWLLRKENNCSVIEEKERLDWLSYSEV